MCCVCNIMCRIVSQYLTIPETKYVKFYFYAVKLSKCLLLKGAEVLKNKSNKDMDSLF